MHTASKVYYVLTAYRSVRIFLNNRHINAEFNIWSMNYEANLFQDYESIAIDELRDQANSLLKLVTEDRRPLHVFMNYDKEFLLFLRTG